jgi:hypothetical protein
VDADTDTALLPQPDARGAVMRRLLRSLKLALALSAGLVALSAALVSVLLALPTWAQLTLGAAFLFGALWYAVHEAGF